MANNSFPAAGPYNQYSLRFMQTGTATTVWTDTIMIFTYPSDAGTPVTKEAYGTGTGVSPTTLAHTTASLPQPGTISVLWNEILTVTTENPVFSPAENGVLLGPFVATLAHIPLANDVITLHWLESAVAKTATITNTSTLGGANAANLSAASINRSSGSLSITFAGGHPPDTNSITVDYKASGNLASVTDDGAGNFTAAGIAGTASYTTGNLSITWTGAGVVPYNGDPVTVSYTTSTALADQRQGWSNYIRVKAYTRDIEVTFDGTNVHALIEANHDIIYEKRHEGAMAIRTVGGTGNYLVQAW